VRGEGELLIVYADLGCPHCAGAWTEICERPARVVFRHFPVSSKHRRAPVLHAAAEAAGIQGHFFEMVDSLYAERGQVDLERFEADRRSEEVAVRVRRDFESGIRGGVTGTPALFPDVPLISGP